VTALIVVVPTRGRPDNAERLEVAFRETASRGAIPVFVADEDDPELGRYRDKLEAGKISRLMVYNHAAGGKGLCFPLNYAARRYAEVVDYVGFMGDDHLPRTHGWDLEMIGELDSLEPRIAYGNDLLQGANLPTAVFMQARMIRAMGIMAPQCMRHLYLDNFWKHLGEQTGGLRYREDVVIEHLHPVAGKAAWDERYAAVNASDRDAADRDAWISYRDGVGFAAALRLVNEEYGRGQVPTA
jgi:hypothetical protein